MGCHYFARSGNYYYTLGRTAACYPYMSNLQSRQARKRSKDARLRQKHVDLDRAFREEISKKKFKLFRQQRHHAKRAIRQDHADPFDEGVTEARRHLRRLRFENLVEKGKISAAHAKAVAASNKLGDAADRVNELGLPHEEWIVENHLSASIKSDFEELEERRRTFNMRARLEAARQKIVRAEEAERGDD